MAATAEYEIRSFATPLAWNRWLDQHHTKQTGIWLRLHKKASGQKSLSYAEALEVALCHGWIDGQKKPHDDVSWLQKFTPRRTRSIWSKRNQGIASRLIAEGRMKPGGAREIDRAKADGRWAQGYDSPGKMEIPADFLKALKSEKKAFGFFEKLNRANRYSIAWRLQTARKPETRERRMKAIIAMLARGEKFH